MRAYLIQQFGVDHLEQVELPMLQIAPGMVLIRVHAVSLNYRDLMVVKGQYNPKMALPRIPCSDGAGEVVAIGDGVEPGAGGRPRLRDLHAAMAGRAADGGEIEGSAGRRCRRNARGVCSAR